MKCSSFIRAFLGPLVLLSSLLGLQPNSMIVRIDTVPPGAMVEVDGVIVCQETPCSRKLTLGQHNLALKLFQHVPIKEDINLNPGMHSVSRTLTPTMAMVNVKTEPDRSLDVYIDDNLVGKTPLIGLKVDQGVHQLSVKSEKYEDNQEVFMVEAGTTRDFDLELIPKVGHLHIEARDQNNRSVVAKVKVANQVIGQTPYDGDVLAGVYDLTLIGKEGVWLRRIKVEKGDHLNLVGKLPRHHESDEEDAVDPFECRDDCERWEDATTLDGGRTWGACGDKNTCIYLDRRTDLRVTGILSRTGNDTNTASPGGYTHDQAIDVCKRSTYGGYAAGTWRLPTTAELFSLFSLQSMASKNFISEQNFDSLYWSRPGEDKDYEYDIQGHAVSLSAPFYSHWKVTPNPMDENDKKKLHVVCVHNSGLKIGVISHEIFPPPMKATGVVSERKQKSDRGTRRKQEKLVSNLKLVKFETDPPGALVEVDGATICKMTPCSAGVSQGKHELAYKIYQYLPLKEEVTVTPQMAPIMRKLKPNFAVVTVRSNPEEGFNVYLDDMLVGTTALDSFKVDPGEHVVTLRAYSYYDKEQSFKVESGQTRIINLKPDPQIGTLRILAKNQKNRDISAQVIIGDRIVGNTPERLQLSARPYEITVYSTEGFWHGQQTVKLNETQEIVAKLNDQWRDITTLDGGKTHSKCGTKHTCIFRNKQTGLLVTGLLAANGRTTNTVSPTEMTWQQAIAKCKSSTYGGYRAGTWRLPTKDEMVQLSGEGIKNLFSPQFILLENTNYLGLWSSTPLEDWPDHGVTVSLDDGSYGDTMYAENHGMGNEASFICVQ